MKRQSQALYIRNPKSLEGFTLIELLTVVAIITIIAAILFPVFALAREKGRAATCLSNEKQLSLALQQYVSDNDSTYPNGIQATSAGRIWQGEGWASQCLPYINSQGVFNCPTDTTSSQAFRETEVSYGYNINLVDQGEGYEDILSGLTDPELNAPSQTVMLFETSAVSVNLGSPREGADGSPPSSTNFSASGNGLDNRLYAQTDATTSTANKYATGYLGGRVPLNLLQTQFPAADGRHSLGSNYVFCDGHAHWLRGSSVSSGVPAADEDCNQDDIPALPGCSLSAGVESAAGTAIGPTFSSY